MKKILVIYVLPFLAAFTVSMAYEKSNEMNHFYHAENGMNVSSISCDKSAPRVNSIELTSSSP